MDTHIMSPVLLVPLKVLFLLYFPCPVHIVAVTVECVIMQNAQFMSKNMNAIVQINVMVMTYGQ